MFLQYAEVIAGHNAIAAGRIEGAGRIKAYSLH